jgi:hypothetical protein
MRHFGEIVEISEVRNYEECIRLSKQIYENQAQILEERFAGKSNSSQIYKPTEYYYLRNLPNNLI